MTKKILMMLIMLLTLVFVVEMNVFAAASWTTTSFTQKDLGYGVTLDYYAGTSKSSFNSLTQADDRKQLIYTANISKDSPARVVQWTKTSIYDNSWSNYTLQQIADDYEEKNPGQKVLVATNNWLADTEANNVGELDGAQVSGGLNFRVSDKQGAEGAWVFHKTYGYIARPAFLGFDASGKKAYFTNDWNNGQNYTDKLMLSFFNGYGTERTKLNIAVDKINEAPNDGEIAIYFKNFDGGAQTFNDAVIYKMNGQFLRYDTKPRSVFVDRDAFAMGKLDSVVTELNSGYGTNLLNCFHIVSKNAEFNALDLTDKTLVAQYELLGDFANVVGGTTYYGHIVRNGEAYPGSFGHWNEINCEVHPRTAFIIKKDGTFALSVIDGRQRDSNGMDYEDMANFYKTQYDGYNVFNYDGGGSSAMIARGEDGNFFVVNNPSDGTQRKVGNATLIVVDEEPFKAKQNTRSENSITIDFANISESVENIQVTLGEVTKEVTNGQVVFEGLSKQTDYLAKIKYTVAGKTYIGATMKVSTSATLAKMSNFKLADATQNSVTIEISVTDPGGIFYRGVVEINGEKQEFKEKKAALTFEKLKYSTEYEVKINIYSDTGASSKEAVEYIKTVETDEAKYIEEIIIKNGQTTLSVGEKLLLDLETYPEGVNSRLQYESSNEEVIRIRSGELEALAPGEAKITVSTSQGVSAEILITVVAPDNDQEEENQKGCKKDLSAYLISTVGMLSLATIVLKKKK